LRFLRGFGRRSIGPLAGATVLVCHALWLPLTSSAAENNIVQQAGVYGKWTLFCTAPPSSASDCALAQAVEDDKNEIIKLRMSISFDEERDLLFQIRVEPKLVERESIALLVDGIQRETLPPSGCDPTGCTSTFHPSTTMLTRVLNGSELEAQFRTEPHSGVSLGLDLTGLRQALVEMWRKLPTPTVAENWFTSFRATSEFEIGLVSVNDLPKDKILDAQSVRNVTAAASALIACGSGAAAVGEYRPRPIRISVDNRFDINYADASNSELTRMADIVRRCGNEYVVTVISDSTADKFSTIYQVQRETIADLVEDHGVNRERIVDFDGSGGLAIVQFPQTTVDVDRNAFSQRPQ